MATTESPWPRRPELLGKLCDYWWRKRLARRERGEAGEGNEALLRQFRRVPDEDDPDESKVFRSIGEFGVLR